MAEEAFHCPGAVNQVPFELRVPSESARTS